MHGPGVPKPMMKHTAFKEPRGLLHVKNAFSEEEMSRVRVLLEQEGWLKLEQAMRFSPLPAWLVSLSETLYAIAFETGFVQEDERHLFAFSQCIVNQYDPPGGLTPHVDLKAFGDLIASVSLCSTVAMDFAPVDDTLSARKITLRLDPGDVLIFKGEARWQWTHAIPARRVDVFDGASIERSHRISITLRTMDPDGHVLEVPAT